MKLTFLRYSKEMYITDGNLPSKVKSLMYLFECEETSKRIELSSIDIITRLFLFKVSNKDRLIKHIRDNNLDIEVEFVDDVREYIRYGNKNENYMLNCIFYIKDQFGNYIYVDLYKNDELKEVSKHPSYYYNKIEIDYLNIDGIEPTIENLTKNTKINVSVYENYFYNDKDYLDLYKIMNRIALVK